MEDYGLKTLQQKILEIALFIDQICMANGIEYYLMGGSALGAVRHKGFIPWDDDFDVFMTSENYYRFLDACKTDMDRDRFYLQEEKTKEWPMYYTKIRMNGTTYIEKENHSLEMHQGIFIDVFCLNNVSDNPVVAFYQYVCGRLLTAQGLSRKRYETDNLVKNTAMYIMGRMPKVVTEFLERQVRSYNGKKCRNVGHFFGKSSFLTSIYPLSCLGSPTYIPFENVMLPVPEKTHEYLSIKFGNYMKMPSLDQRRAAQHATIIDVNKDYTEYVAAQG